MIDRPHTKIMLFRPEGIFHLGQLNVPLPYRFWISLLPVGAQYVVAATLKRPLITVFVFFDIDHKTSILACPYFCNSHVKKGRSTAVSLKKPSNPTFCLLLISESSLLRLFFEIVKPCLQSYNEPVEDCCLFVFTAFRAAQHKGLVFAFGACAFFYFDAG